jgi:redox-sensitive bicupin YhaK (pirin superfamily)
MLSETKSRFEGKKIIHKADTRGYFDYGWLKTSHTFSFSSYYDPERVNFGMLRVLNDDFVAAGEGFGTHPHNDMEIVTIPLDGALAHKDSTGSEGVIYPDEVQIMSAGTGIRHSEFNHLQDGSSNFLQLWIFPDKKGHQPRYNQNYFDPAERKNKFQFIVTPEKKGGNLWLNQDAFLSRIDLDKNNSVNYKIHTKGNGVYLFLIDGKITVGNEILSKRDGIGIWEVDEFSISANLDSSILLIEVPME